MRTSNMGTMDIGKVFSYFNKSSNSRLSDFIDGLVEESPDGKQARAVFHKVYAELGKKDKHLASEFDAAIGSFMVAHQDLVFPVGFALGQVFKVNDDCQGALKDLKQDLKKANVVPWPKEQTTGR